MLVSPFFCYLPMLLLMTVVVYQLFVLNIG